MVWDKNGWRKFEQRSSKAKDPNKLRVNSYRVLLTRGRDGFVIYVPEDNLLNGVYETLVNAGVNKL